MMAEGGHILVVDDNRMNRIKLARGLEQQGHTVALAENGQQALEMVRAGPFDVMLLDIVMPEMDGYQVLAGQIGKSQRTQRSLRLISCRFKAELR